MLSVNFLWVIFNSENASSAGEYIRGMLGVYNKDFNIDDTMKYYIREYGIYILAGIVFSTPLVHKLRMLISKHMDTIFIDFFEPIVYGFVFIWSISFLVLGSHNPFIYFNF